MFNSSKSIIDSHFHIRGTTKDETSTVLSVASEIARKMGLTSTCIASIPAWDENSIGQNVLTIVQKALNPNTYAYAGFDHYCFNEPLTGEDFFDQLKSFLEMGFDGIKSIEYKPSVRKKLGYGFDEHFNQCFAYMQEHKVPLLWHVADPEENWNADMCSDYVKNAGWCYDHPSFPKKEELYEETEQILISFPNLRVVFAHLFFLSGDVKRLRSFLDRHRTVSIDVTPGSEMYYNFNKNPIEWREFFCEYADRILFGTDNGWGDDTSPAQKVVDGCSKLAMLDAYFSTDQIVHAWDETSLQGLHLPDEALSKMYSINFLKLHNNRKPKNIDLKLVMKYSTNLFNRIKSSSLVGEQQKKQIIDAIDIVGKLTE